MLPIFQYNIHGFGPNREIQDWIDDYYTKRLGLKWRANKTCAL